MYSTVRLTGLFDSVSLVVKSFLFGRETFFFLSNLTNFKRFCKFIRLLKFFFWTNRTEVNHFSTFFRSGYLIKPIIIWFIHITKPNKSCFILTENQIHNLETISNRSENQICDQVRFFGYSYDLFRFFLVFGLFEDPQSIPPTKGNI